MCSLLLLAHGDSDELKFAVVQIAPTPKITYFNRKVLFKPVNICNLKGFEMIKTLVTLLLQCRSIPTSSVVLFLQNECSFRDI